MDLLDFRCYFSNNLAVRHWGFSKQCLKGREASGRPPAHPSQLCRGKLRGVDGARYALFTFPSVNLRGIKRWEKLTAAKSRLALLPLPAAERLQGLTDEIKPT